MERSRRTAFADRIRTRIWEELPDPANPYHARGARCHGYALEEMVEALDPGDTLFLLLRGELPSAAESRLLRRFLVAFCNPGPRHAATRAVMNAAASGTRAQALAPIGLAVLGGEHLGSAEVEQAAHFILRHRGRDPAALAAALAAEAATVPPGEGDRRIAPGFGSHFGAPDPYAAMLAGLFEPAAAAGGAIEWGGRLARGLHGAAAGWLVPGVAAAVCVELGFGARAAGLLFQLAAMPGLIAHGLEMAGQGITAMPFVADADYVLLADTAAETVA